ARHSSCVQLIPPGELVTLPLTSPFVSLERRTPSSSGVKVATIVVSSWSSVSVQVPVPGQSGVLQPEKLLPASAFAVSVTVFPWSYPQRQSSSPSLFWHGCVTGLLSLFRSTPAGDAETVPGPRGATCSVTVAAAPPPAADASAATTRAAAAHPPNAAATILV